MLTPVFEWLESTGVATGVGQSLMLTALASAIHMLGLTLVAGGAAVAWLRLLGVLLPERPIREITGAVENGMLAGLGVSLASGLLLFAPRASIAAGNSTFQWKMLLLFAAVAFHFTIFRSVSRHAGSVSWPLRLAARALGLSPGNARARLFRAREALKKRLMEFCGACAEHGCLDCWCKKERRRSMEL